MNRRKKLRILVMNENNTSTLRNNITSEDTFFKVSLCRLYWEDEQSNDGFFAPPAKKIPCSDFLAVVNMDSKQVYGTVTKNYVLYTHKETFELGMKIGDYLFKDDIARVQCFRVNASKNIAAVEYALCSRLNINQPDIVDGWIPVIIMGNSYNKTKTLECGMGFYNRDFNLDILFPEFMIKAKSAHVFNKKSMECSIWNQVKQKSGNIKTFIDSFKDMLNKLKNSRIAASDMLPLYCKVKNMKKSDKLLTWQRESLIDELSFVNKRIKFYTKIFDYSAYTLLLVVADAVENFDKDSLRLRSNEYLGLGKWVEDYLEAAGAPGYSPYKYIGEDAHDVASWFETLK